MASDKDKIFKKKFWVGYTNFQSVFHGKRFFPLMSLSSVIEFYNRCLSNGRVENLFRSFSDILKEKPSPILLKDNAMKLLKFILFGKPSQKFLRGFSEKCWYVIPSQDILKSILKSPFSNFLLKMASPQNSIPFNVQTKLKIASCEVRTLH